MFSVIAVSTFAVAISEIGDKTQLLSLLLVTRFPQQKLAIIAGIIVATLLNHFASAWLGLQLSKLVASGYLDLLIALSFIIIGLWILRPDEAPNEEEHALPYSAFITTCVLFFLAEIGDKTQMATLSLAINYQAIAPVVIGSTLGLLIANVPAVYLGAWLLQRLPVKHIRLIACLFFVGFGLYLLLKTLGEHFSF